MIPAEITQRIANRYARMFCTIGDDGDCWQLTVGELVLAEGTEDECEAVHAQFIEYVAPLLNRALRESLEASQGQVPGWWHNESRYALDEADSLIGSLVSSVALDVGSLHRISEWRALKKHAMETSP